MHNYCIISHRYRFLYVPIAKVACTSLLNRIAEIIHGPRIRDVITSSHRDVHSKRAAIFNTKESEISYNTLRAIRQYDNYFKFAFVRNPFDRAHSCYVDKLSMSTYGFDNNLIKRYPQMYRGMEFTEFLKCVQRIPLAQMDEHFRPQYSFFPRGGLDFIGKLESMNEDWKRIENILGISSKPLEIYNKTQEIDYYNEEAEELIREIYAKDFEQFEYSLTRQKKPLPARELPLEISAHTLDRIYPFKDVFIEWTEDGLDATVTGNNPIIIVPYFTVRNGKRVIFEIDIYSEVETTLTIFYTGKNDLDKPHSKSCSAPLREGDNHLVLSLDDDDIAGRFRIQVSKTPGKFKIRKIRINEQTLPWLEDPLDLTETTRRLFSLPPYTQTCKNLSSMCNYASLYIPILDVLRPRHICEIGCDQGDNTSVLLHYCKKHNIKLTIVDPAEIDTTLLDSYDFLVHVRKKSVEFLNKTDRCAEVYFVDGDHNYATVSRELELIDRIASKSDYPTCIFVHDVSWPWAYRDLYYTPEDLRIPSSRYTVDKGVSLYSAKPTEDGLPTLGQYAFCVEEGGEKNGVLKAIEDFLQQNKQWHFVAIPSIYGLGVMWTKEKLSEPQKRIFAEIREHFLFFKEFLSILEWNRLALYSQIIRNAKTWKRDQSYIKKLKAKPNQRGPLERLKGALTIFKLK